MKWVQIYACLFLVVLAGCTEDDSGKGNSLEVIEVAIETDLNQPVGETIDLQAQVTQGSDFVEDADEVLFEVWANEDREHAEFYEAEHTRNGLYSVPIQFDLDGIYMMQAHVTARDMHVMPTQEMFAGDVSDEDRDTFYDEE